MKKKFIYYSPLIPIIGMIVVILVPIYTELCITEEKLLKQSKLVQGISSIVMIVAISLFYILTNIYE